MAIWASRIRPTSTFSRGIARKAARSNSLMNVALQDGFSVPSDQFRWCPWLCRRIRGCCRRYCRQERGRCGGAAASTLPAQGTLLPGSGLWGPPNIGGPQRPFSPDRELHCTDFDSLNGIQGTITKKSGTESTPARIPSSQSTRHRTQAGLKFPQALEMGFPRVQLSRSHDFRPPTRLDRPDRTAPSEFRNRRHLARLDRAQDRRRSRDSKRP